MVGSDKLRFDHEARTIRFQRPGVELNFGSIGKGYALDRMAAAMRGNMNSALLSAGSSSSELDRLWNDYANPVQASISQ